MNYESIVIQSLADLPNFTGVNTLILDTETSGLSPYHGDRICGIAISPFHSHKNFYIPIRHAEQPSGVYDGTDLENLPPENVFNWLRQYTADQSKTWILHHAGYDINMFRFENIQLVGPLFDTMVLAHVFDGSLYQYGLDVLTKIYIQFRHEQYKVLNSWIENVLPRGKTEEGVIDPNYSLLPIHIVGNYANEDLQATRELMQHLDKQPQYSAPYNYGNPAQGTKELIQNEMQLVKVLADMEFRGVRVDLALARDLRDTALDEIARYEQAMFRCAGHSFSFTAWSQRTEALEQAGGRVLFWNLPEEERGKQKRDQYTTDKALSTGRPNWNSSAVLEYLKVFRQEQNQPAYDFVLAYHEAATRQQIVSLYLEAILRGADQSGRIHGQVKQTGTVTGRLSAAHPNLQNIATTKGTRDQKTFEKFLGHKDEQAVNRRIRSLFLPDPGEVFVSCDWSNVEYRVATYFSEDGEMIANYQAHPDLDYHEETAKLMGVDRDIAKTINFAVLFFMGPASLASLLGNTKEEAKVLFDRLFAARPALRKMMNRVPNEARRNGYVQNPLGRVCPVIVDREYASLNHLIQGQTGDMMRHALVRLAKFIDKAKLSVKMLLTVHDEICFSMPQADVLSVVPQVVQQMCHAPWVSVPITADAEAGPTWADVQPLAEWAKAG